MNNLSYLSLFVVFILCSSCTKQGTSKEDLNKHTMYMGVPAGPLQGLEDDRSFIDPAVSGLEFNSEKTSRSVVGRGILGQSTRYGNLRVANTSKTEVLELVAHPGSAKNQFSEFRLGKTTPEIVAEQGIPILEKIPTFKTVRGISLGMTVSEVKKLLGSDGPNKEQAKDNRRILRYRIEGKENSAYLKKMNMPVYFADYIFDMGALIHIHWGVGAEASRKDK